MVYDMKRSKQYPLDDEHSIDVMRSHGSSHVAVCIRFWKNQVEVKQFCDELYQGICWWKHHGGHKNNQDDGSGGGRGGDKKFKRLTDKELEEYIDLNDDKLVRGNGKVSKK